MAKSYTIESQLVKRDGHLYPLQFYVSDKLVQKLKNDKVKRLQVSINGNDPIDSSLISGGNQNYFIKINTLQMKKMSLSIGDSATLVISPDQSKYGMSLPDEFTAIWELDDEANGYFHALTPGKQRNLIYVVNKVKSLDIRMRKAMIIMEHLKINNGKIDYKILNESMKSS